MIKVHPRTYNKEEFLKFLKKNNVNDNIITKFVELPEKIVRNGNTYDLYIGSMWYSEGDTYYTFELNYYSKEHIEVSINNLLCELMRTNLIKRNGNC